MDPAQVAAYAAHFQPPPTPPPPQQPSYSVENPPTPVANPTPNLSQPTPSHPSYAEMIASAIMFDNSQGKESGSSKRAIAKYIDRVYSDLPPTHSALLTHHLKRLKNSGQLVMIKNSYQLPSFFPASPPPTRAELPEQQPIAAPLGTDQSGATKRKPGRPAKVKRVEIEPQFLSVTDSPGNVSGSGMGLNEGVMNGNGSGGSLGKRPRGRPPKVKNMQSQVQHQVEVPIVDSGVSNGKVEVDGSVKRGGRPQRKQQYVYEDEDAVEEEVEVELVVEQPPGYETKRKPGRPAKASTGVGVGVQKVNNVLEPMSDTAEKKRGWPKGKLRGRKRTVARVMDVPVAVNVGVGGKRRGRKPKGSVAAVTTEVDKPVYTGKPRGRPKRNSTLVEHTSGQGQEKASEELMITLQDMQSKLKDAVRVIRPHLDHSAPDVLAALQQLEELSTMNATPSSTVTEPPVMTVPMDVTAPPQSTSIPETSVASVPSLIAPTMMAFTASPAMNEPVPYSMNVPSMTANEPFPAPNIGNQQQMSWVPSNEAQS